LSGRTDVRVVQRRQQSGFALEARHSIDVRHEPRWKDFERDIAAKFRVTRAIDDAHAAGAKQRQNFVGAYLPPDQIDSRMLIGYC
jgi:hypothetical protein